MTHYLLASHSKLPAFNAQALLNTLSGLASAGFRPSPRWLRAAGQHALRLLPSMACRDVVQLEHLYSHVFLCPLPPEITAAAEYTYSRWVEGAGGQGGAEQAVCSSYTSHAG